VVTALCLWTSGCGDRSTDRLIAELGSSDSAARRAAARGLVNSGGTSKKVIEALASAADDEDTQVRETAIEGLGKMGSHANACLPALKHALEDPQSSVRVSAALAICRIDPSVEVQQPVILEALRRGHATVFLEVGQMGNRAEWAVTTLVELSNHPRPHIRALSARTLGEIGIASDVVTASLKRCLQDSERAVRTAAERALEQIESRNASSQ
jgi:hypothetical protein